MDSDTVRHRNDLLRRIDRYALDDRPSDGMSAGISSDDHAGEVDELDHEDGEEGLAEPGDEVFAVERVQGDGAETDEPEQADLDAVVVVGGAGEEEGEGRPVGCEGDGGAVGDQARLDEDRVFGAHCQDGPEGGWVGGCDLAGS